MITAAQPLAAHIFDTDRRRAAREEVALETQMADRWGRVFPAQLINLSSHGFMATTEVQLCERDPVRIEIPTIGWQRAEVAWVLGDRLGAALRDPIAEHAFLSFVSVFGTTPRG